MKFYLLTLLFFLPIYLYTQQFTEQTAISLTGVSSSSVAWGDYDNDGFLDILLTGYDNSGGVSKIYHNNGNNTFTEQTSISLTGVGGGSIVWGDYDNDGDIDILLTGYTNLNGCESKIYRNNGNNTFIEQTAISLTGVSSSSVAWGDYDNDGDLDILLTGYTCSTYVSKIYRNNNEGTFTEQTSISLIGIGSSSVAWGDYNNDGYLDILLTGWASGTIVSKIYKNNGDGTFTQQTSISLTPVNSSSVAWGDYDNDSYLDILLTGWASGSKIFSKIYRNNGDGSFTEQTSISLTGVQSGSVAWGDYDNDGYLDIILTGDIDFSYSKVSKIYRNNGNGSFTEQTSISLTDVGNSSVAWGDYDNDGDLDILLTGKSSSLGEVSKIYRNNNPTPNTLPTPPTNLSSNILGQEIIFNWNKSTDNETSQNGLRYNLVIGSSPNSVNILSPMSNRHNGYRRIISLGNTNHCNSWKIRGLGQGTYYWSVQAIDNTFAASSFSPEQSFSFQDFIVGYDRIEFYENVSPNSSNPMNLINVGNKIRFKIRIVNFLPQNILTAYGILSTNDPNILITDSTCTFNNVLSNQTVWSVDEFEIEPNSNIPLGSVVGFTLKVQQVLTPTGPWYSSFSFPVVPLIVDTSLMDDDNNPDSQGNGNGIVEPNETIETVPLISNISSNTIYKVSCTLKSPYSFADVWNNVSGVSGLVYDTYRYNLISNQQQPLLPGQQNIQPEVDYVFTYNASNIYQLPFNLIVSGYYGGEPGLYWYSGGVKMKWSSGFTLNQGYPPVSIKDEENKLPTEFALAQNYPNPFNPSTRISWQSPVSSWQTLKVYDVLGNEVATLVDEYKPAGNYEVEFSTVGMRHASSATSTLPSGVYFYQLRINDLIETKKMILLR